MIFAVFFVIAAVLLKILNSLLAVVTFIPTTALGYVNQITAAATAWNWLIPTATVYSILGLLVAIVYAEFMFHSATFFYWLLRNTFRRS